MTGETNLRVLIKNMQPIFNDGLYVFCRLPNAEGIDLEHIVFFFKEEEGLTVVVEKVYADAQRYKYASVFVWITLHIYSSLDAVGLTAAFSNALADNGLSCNVVAGYYHDHIFVHETLGRKAVAVLAQLAAEY